MNWSFVEVKVKMSSILFIIDLFSVAQNIVLQLLLDPINQFCLLFLFLNTAGYILILKAFAVRRHRYKGSSAQRASTEPKEPGLPAVSFIIPAHNEEETIERKLRNTFALDYPKHRLEVLVVDDESTDKTPKILEEIKNSWFPQLKVIRQMRKGKSAAENAGLQNSSGEIVVISDADVELSLDSLRFMVEDFRDPKVGGVTCTVRASEKNVHAFNFKLGLLTRQLESEIDSSFGMAGSFVSFRRHILPRIDEGIFSSDADAGLMIRKKGYRVLYDPRIIGFVDKWVEGKPKSIPQAIKKLKHMSFGSITLLRRHKDVLFRSRHGLFGWVIAPKRILFDTLAPIIFMLLSVNSIVKLFQGGLIIPFALLVTAFVIVSLLSRRVVPYSMFSRALYLILMYAITYYAAFFYYFHFGSRRRERYGAWEKFRV